MVQLDRAQALIAEGNVDQARDLLAENSRFQECAVRLRELLVGEGLHADAEPVVRDLANGTGPESGVSRAILAFQQGDLQLESFIVNTEIPEILDMYDVLVCGSRNHIRGYTTQLDNQGVTYEPQFLPQTDYDEILNGEHEMCNN